MCSTECKRRACQVLGPATARELMSPNPVSINARTPVPEAVVLLSDRGFSAAPVIDEAGRPIGVITRTDILIHQRERVSQFRHRFDFGGVAPATIPEADEVAVVDVMTPAIFSVTADSSAETVVREMLELHVHQLFVVDHSGCLIGVISALDVLRHLHPELD